MYSTRMISDFQAVFILEFDGEEIEVAKCSKAPSGTWYIHSTFICENFSKSFTSPQAALEAYKAYVIEVANREE